MVYGTKAIDNLNLKFDEMMLEAYLNQTEENMYLYEGTNQDYTDTFKEGFKKYKESLKAGKKYFKDNDTKKASKEFADAIKYAKDIDNGLEKIRKDETVGSGIIGYFIACLVGCVQSAMQCIPLLGLPVMVGNIYLSVKGLLIIVKDIKNGELTVGKFFNVYYRRLKAATSLLIKVAEASEKKCK